MSPDRSYYDAVVIISPAVGGGEKKDQDRAAWFEKSYVAVVCDGTSSSPHAAEAAELTVSFTPPLFRGDLKSRLATLCDFLEERRLQSLHRPVVLARGTPAGMRQALIEVVMKQRQQGFQTTLTCVALTILDGRVSVRLLTCGDSAFFAFDPEGHLLADSLCLGTDGRIAAKEVPGSPSQAPGSQMLRFVPGDEMLCRAICTLSNWPELAAEMGIPAGHADRWLVCRPLDVFVNDRWGSSNDNRAGQVSLTPSHLLVVPDYLVTRPRDEDYVNYRRCRLSTQVRIWPAPQADKPPSSSSGAGSVTAVLPDHFYQGRWHYSEEMFPLEAQFLLATDGFYRSFADPSEQWSWLQEHERQLLHNDTRAAPMMELHAGLARKRGDDDMSFVWLRPSAVQKLEDEKGNAGGSHGALAE
jgi:hypothetical protein